MMGRPALEMKARLAAAGLSMDSRAKEPPDHLAVQLEYLYFLLSKFRVDHDTLLIEKAVSFTSGTLLPWVRKLKKRLISQTDYLFYSLSVSLLIAVLEFIGTATTFKDEICARNQTP